jgi:hypothetical protein
MSWLFDHVNVIYILLGIVALGLVTAWWLNKRVKFLVLAAIPITLIGLVWLLGQFVVTDQQEIHQSLEAMADAVVRQDADALFRHVSESFRYHNMNRKEMYDRVARAIRLHKVGAAFISDYRAEEVSRSTGRARVSFRVRVDNQGGDMVFFARCEADFLLEAGQWKLSGVEFFNAVANQDRPINIPLP